MNITAIVLTAGNYPRTWPGLQLVVQRQIITSAAELLAARFAAIGRVTTRRFFFLDDDDDLPLDYLDVIDECERQQVTIAYTDEIVTTSAGDAISRKGEYSREAHRKNALLVHHLVLCDTAAAAESVQRLPRGHFCPELLLYWDLARNGAAYVPRVGYHWHKRPSGMHAWPATTLSQARARIFNDARAALCASA